MGGGGGGAKIKKNATVIVFSVITVRENGTVYVEADGLAFIFFSRRNDYFSSRI